MTTFDSTSADLTDRRSYRTLASAIAVFLGAYLVTSTLSGQLGLFLTGISQPPADVVVLYVLQAIFGIAVVIGGFLLAPGTLGARLIASALVIAVVVIVLASQAARITGDVPRGASIPMSMTVANGYFMVALAVGAGWLLVRRARVAWLALLLAAVLIPVPYVMAMAGLSFGITQIVCFGLSGVVLAAILIAGRPLRD